MKKRIKSKGHKGRKKGRFKRTHKKLLAKVEKYLEKEDRIPLSIELKEMLHTFNREKPTFGDFLDHIKEKGFGFLMMIIALPSALPVPAGGYSIPFAIVMGSFGIQIIRRQRVPYFPQWIKKKKFSKKFFHSVFAKFSKFASFLEYFSKPRAAFLFRGPFRIVLGLVILVISIVMAIPLPLSNTAPAFSLLLIGFAMLNNDGLFLIFSYFVGIIAMCIAFIAALFGVNLIRWLIELAMNLF